MKKVVILLLATVYMFVTSGVVINIHYCMGRVAEVNYGHDNDDNCGKCGMQKKEGCCKTEHKFVKAGADQVQPSGHHQLQLVAAPLSSPVATPEFSVSTSNLSSLRYHSPPDPRSNAIRLHNGVFRV